MQKQIILIGIISLFFCGGVFCKTQQEWSTRTIYQIITDRFATTDGSSPACDLNDQPNYCGGTFKGIQNNLDYITGMGFDAIWISPVVANLPNQFHGYAAQNFYEINPHFGTEQDLKDLVNACHDNGVWVIFDIVVNHVGAVGTNFSTIVPFNDSSYYHTPCSIGSNDYCTTDEVELNCRLADLPDLNQSVTYVQQTLVSWIQWLISEFNIDGLRLDTVPYVPTWFWDQFTPASGVFQAGEVECSDCSFVGQFIQHVNGVLGYPLYYALQQAFAYKNSMNGLQTYNQECIQNFPNNAISVMPFADNHDNPRFLSINPDWNQLKAYVTYVLTSIGIPIMYYGTEQGFNGKTDPYDREPLWTSNYNTSSPLYEFVQQVVSIRKSQQVWNYPQVQRYSDDQFYAFTRGNTFVALTNQDSNIQRNITYHPYSNGTLLCNQLVSGDCVTVTNGAFQVYLNNGETKIFTISTSQHNSKQFLEK